MGECHQFVGGRGCRRSRTAGGFAYAGSGQGRWGGEGRYELQMPKASGGSASAREDASVGGIIDGDGGCIENDTAACVAELADGDEGCCREIGNDVYMTSSDGKSRNVQFGLVSRIHYGAVRITDADGLRGRAPIENVGIDRTEVRCAAAVGNGESGRE